MLKVSLAIACTVSCRGWHRPDRTPKTICAQIRADRAFCDRWLRCVCVPAVAGASGGGVCRACAAGPCAAGCSLPSRPGSALRCQGPTPPARSRPRRSTRPGPAAGGRRPSARPRRRPGSGRGRLRIPIRASPRAWSRQGPKGPAAAATGPCCYHEPSWHYRPGGGSAPSSRAAATRTVPPGGRPGDRNLSLAPPAAGSAAGGYRSGHGRRRRGRRRAGQRAPGGSPPRRRAGIRRSCPRRRPG